MSFLQDDFPRKSTVNIGPFAHGEVSEPDIKTSGNASNSDIILAETKIGLEL